MRKMKFPKLDFTPMVIVIIALVVGVSLEYLVYATGHFTEKVTFLEYLTLDRKILFMR
ncbi:hypothetical protein [Acidaminococcus sp.]|uniref:hypothetical protein n=1 Tax=Acidaminococcus sp. TaxID=1872103 RepID=UPI003522D6BB